MFDTMQVDITTVKESRLSSVDFSDLKFGKVFTDHMFVADYHDGKWQDFRVVPYEQIKLSPAVSALHYGQSIFEGMKAYKNEAGEVLIFRPDANLARMNASAVRMCMPELTDEVFLGGLNHYLSMDKGWIPNAPGCALYLRPFMFATDEYVGIRPSDTYKFIIFGCPVASYYSEPVKVKIETEYSRSFIGGTGAAKTAGNYAAALYPSILALQNGYHQLIWTDGREHKYIEESGTMNVMFIIDGKLITPDVKDDTILKGVTRNSVLTLARDWGMTVEERKVEVAEVVAAVKSGRMQEAFGTGTAATIAAISVISHDGIDYSLPAVETREFSHKVLKTLDAIKTGAMEDPYGWIYKVQ